MNVERISAITLKVRDMQESVRVYMNILGLKGADVNAKDESGTTALTLAAGLVSR